MPDTLHQASRAPAFHKLPPQSIEAEESILSAILIENSTLMDILEILSADDFYKTAHQIIFSAIETLYAKSEPVDLVTLSNMLREKGELEKIGGAAYLARLVDAVPMAVNAHHYARIIHDKAILRRLIERPTPSPTAVSKIAVKSRASSSLPRAPFLNFQRERPSRPFTPSARLLNPTSTPWKSARATGPW
jgi:replicative DNA helicase